MRESLIKIFTAATSVIISVCILYALLLLMLFIAAFIIGGDSAESLCVLMDDVLFPALYICGSVAAFTGIIKMYLAGEKELTLEQADGEEPFEAK